MSLNLFDLFTERLLIGGALDKLHEVLLHSIELMKTHIKAGVNDIFLIQLDVVNK